MDCRLEMNSLNNFMKEKEKNIIYESPTPETDALRDLFENYENRVNMGDVWELCETLEKQRNSAITPICVGRPIIEILSKDGVWVSENGNSLIAASCLYGKNPYSQNTPQSNHE